MNADKKHITDDLMLFLRVQVYNLGFTVLHRDNKDCKYLRPSAFICGQLFLFFSFLSLILAAILAFNGTTHFRALGLRRFCSRWLLLMMLLRLP